MNRAPLKSDKPELKDVYAQPLQNVQEEGWYDSFTYPQPEKGIVVLAEKLHVPKIRDLKIKLHRQIEGRIKRLTIRKAKTGKWFACFSVEIEDLPKPPWKDESIVGIDVGLASFATLSNGEKIIGKLP